MTRVFNFSPGPATLPETVLRQAAAEMLDWNGSGMSVMEMSHRGKEFIGIHAQAESLLRELMGIPATGNPVAFDVIDIVRVRDGQLVEHWNVVDALVLMQQVGAVPTPA